MRSVGRSNRLRPTHPCTRRRPHHPQGKFAEARAAYNAGLAQDPNNATGIAEKAEVEQAAKTTERARELLAQQNGNGGNGGGGDVRAARQASALVDAAMGMASQSFELRMLKVRPEVVPSVTDALSQFFHH